MVEEVSTFTPSRVSPAELQSRIGRGPAEPIEGGASFAEALDAQGAAEELRFSAHAQQRLRSRDIRLSERDKAELARAVDMAGRKGARESLVMIEDLSLIVSIRNRVVITAMERGTEDPNVFTHIDSAVVLPRGRERIVTSE